MDSSTTRERIAQNLEEVRARITEAARRAGRSPESVRLVAVTKSVGIAEAQALLDLGVTDLGENRVDIAQNKIEAIEKPVCWHMIGNVQRRKARDIVVLFDRVDAVDRIEVAEALDKRCRELGKILPILIEVNVSGEESKHGFEPDEVAGIIDRIGALDALRVEGLMTMAPFVGDPETVRPVFARLRDLAAQLDLHALSMGMTNDFEVAIEEGATEVRVGTALFV